MFHNFRLKKGLFLINILMISILFGFGLSVVFSNYAHIAYADTQRPPKPPKPPTGTTVGGSTQTTTQTCTNGAVDITITVTDDTGYTYTTTVSMTGGGAVGGATVTYGGG